MEIKRIIDIKNSIAVVELEGKRTQHIQTNRLLAYPDLLTQYHKEREQELQAYRNHGL